MLVMRYAHRLPADYDMDRIRVRAAARGPLWHEAPGLGVKVFSATERGRRGAIGNAYASTYLWLDPAAALGFLTDARFGAVTDTFGRPQVETWLPLAVAAGPREAARSLRRETVAVEPGADLGRLRATEAERGRAALADGALAVICALDPTGWRLTRFVLSAEAGQESSEDVLHLAAPGWAHLA